MISRLGADYDYNRNPNHNQTFLKDLIIILFLIIHSNQPRSAINKCLFIHVYYVIYLYIFVFVNCFGCRLIY